jgi:hypothetical protein
MVIIGQVLIVAVVFDVLYRRGFGDGDGTASERWRPRTAGSTSSGSGRGLRFARGERRRPHLGYERTSAPVHGTRPARWPPLVELATSARPSAASTPSTTSASTLSGEVVALLVTTARQVDADEDAAGAYRSIRARSSSPARAHIRTPVDSASVGIETIHQPSRWPTTSIASPTCSSAARS